MEYGNYIEINGTDYFLCDEPLSSYWGKFIEKPVLCSGSTSPFDKGYFAKWVLSNGKLFLTDFSGGCWLTKKHYSFVDFFGTKNERHFASWFSGSLTVQDGKVIFSDHHFGDTKEYTFLLIFDKGKIVKTEMQETG